MIREFKPEDLSDIMRIWLDANIQAHDFIEKEYWIANFDMVESILPGAEVYVYEAEGEIKAFAGIDSGHIAGLFVAGRMQSMGIGKLLLDKCKELYSTLTLSVYEKNRRAVYFYKRAGFTVEKSRTDEKTGEDEYCMVWKK